MTWLIGVVSFVAGAVAYKYLGFVVEGLITWAIQKIKGA